MKVEKRRCRGEFVQEHNQQVLETGCGMRGPLASGLGYWRSDLAVLRVIGLRCGMESRM